MAKEKTDAPEESSVKSKLAIFENKAILLGTIVIMQALIAIGLTQFLIVPQLGVKEASVDPAVPAEEKFVMPEMGVLVGLEEIIVTLRSDGRKSRYLRININLEVQNQGAAMVVTERLPQLRDIVIMILSNLEPVKLSTPEGKKGLRDEIFRRIDERMPPGILMNVYFSDLVVQ
ncbi:MAG: flagellar basal body-associated FliL family protein [Gemmatimonadales bacterium]|nr:flagellar basal body-associated FliL family protein [Gemmatimonadales bacterium]